MNNLILDLFYKNEISEIPIWFLRQSGRHIPEYFLIRNRARDFIDFCSSTNLIVEATKLPLKYYNLDAAIVFSDILMIPWIMKRDVKFEKSIGPILNPLIPNDSKIIKDVNVVKKLEPLKQALKILRKDLPSQISLIGFSGAPWTIACYMIEGRSSKDFVNTRKALWNSNKWFMELIETLTMYIIDKLEMQAKAGADILMIFDSWSHMIPNNFFKEMAINPTKKIINVLRSKNINVPIIGLPFKAGTSLVDYSYESEVDCIALDWTVNIDWAIKNLNPSVAIQGNLDPVSLIPENSEHLEKNVNLILNSTRQRRFIFNVGHGITPECKMENVKRVVEIVKTFKK